MYGSTGARGQSGPPAGGSAGAGAPSSTYGPPSGSYMGGPGYPAPPSSVGYAPPAAGAGYGYGYEAEAAYAYGAPGGSWAGRGRPPSQYFACIKMRGLPFGVPEQEVGMFLGVDTIDILLVRQNGRATGEAYAILAHPPDMEIALRKHKAYLGSRYIEIAEARKHDYYNAVVTTFGDLARGRNAGAPGGAAGARSRSRSPGAAPRPPANPTSVLKLRGLPFSATVDDVVAFFDDPALGIAPPTAENVTIALASDGRPNGIGFVEFDSPEAAVAAMAKHRELIGTRYVEIFPSTEEERARYATIVVGAANPYA